MFNKKRIQELEAEVQSLRAQLYETNRLSEVRSILFSVSSRVLAASGSSALLSEQLAAAETALEKEQIRNQSVSKDNEALRGALTQVQEDVKQGRERIEHMAIIGRDLMDRLQKAQSEALSFRMENAGLKAEIKELEEDADVADEMLAELKTAVQKGNEAILQKDAEISRLKNECSIPPGRPQVHKVRETRTEDQGHCGPERPVVVNERGESRQDVQQVDR
jgi:chromosome segregation ATPase